MDVSYTESLDGIRADHLHGFFVGWPQPPSPETHLRLLHGRTHVVLARETAGEQNVIGYVTAVADGVLFAFVSSLEVLPEYKGKGIGTELMRRLIATIGDLYAIDLICDPDVMPFYARLGMREVSAMCIRNYDSQTGL